MNCRVFNFRPQSNPCAESQINLIEVANSLVSRSRGIGRYQWRHVRHLPRWHWENFGTKFGLAQRIGQYEGRAESHKNGGHSGFGSILVAGVLNATDSGTAIVKRQVESMRRLLHAQELPEHICHIVQSAFRMLGW